jgi:hypothetical protein
VSYRAGRLVEKEDDRSAVLSGLMFEMRLRDWDSLDARQRT